MAVPAFGPLDAGTADTKARPKLVSLKSEMALAQNAAQAWTSEYIQAWTSEYIVVDVLRTKGRPLTATVRRLQILALSAAGQVHSLPR